jgi:L,D-transpeptidase ErfK/SrfK
MFTRKITKILLKIIFSFSILVFAFPESAWALHFQFPLNGNIVGEVQTTVTKKDEDFSDIAEKFDLGYYELFEANPGVDPDEPPEGVVLIIPTKYIIPKELNQNIVINLAEMRLYYNPPKTKDIYIYPIGIGKEDWETPLGVLTIKEKIPNPKWVVPDSIYKYRAAIGDKVEKVIPPGPDNPLGNYAMRLSNPDFLIHGTNIPEGVGRRSSAGCIRLYPEDIEPLFKMVAVGTEVVIINRPYKAGWEDGKLYLEAHMPLFEQRLEWGDDVSPAISALNEAGAQKSTKLNWNKVLTTSREHVGIPRLVETPKQ